MFTKVVLHPPPFVYVVTVAWNHLSDTVACLASLLRMTYPNFRVLLVDNGSVDGTAKVVGEEFPQVEVIVNPENLGFSAGYNIGVRGALERGAGWVLILNNDTTVAPDLLEALMAYTSVPGAGMLAPKIYAMAEPNRIWSVGGQRSWWTLEMVDTGDGQVDAGQWESPLERDYLVGCALLLSRAFWQDLGGFDAETFSPAYYEDADLSLRARRAGHRLLLVPSARMWHKGTGSSGGMDSPQQRYLMARNSVRFFRKHVRGLRWLIVIPYRLGSAVRTSLRLLRLGRREALRAHWRGLRDGVLGR